MRRTATVFFSPPAQLAATVFLPESLMNEAVCLPAVTLTPSLGVSPSGRPSSSTFETGIELKLNVQGPPPDVPADVVVEMVLPPPVDAELPVDPELVVFVAVVDTELLVVVVDPEMVVIPVVGATWAVEAVFGWSFSSTETANVFSVLPSNASGMRTS